MKRRDIVLDLAIIFGYLAALWLIAMGIDLLPAAGRR
jgi:preprotein translocase subunit SecE